MKAKEVLNLLGITRETLSRVGNEKLDSDEIFEEIISLLHCFSMKHYSKRKIKKVKEAIDEDS